MGRKVEQPYRKRNADIVRRSQAGETAAALAQRYGVSRERIREIVQRAKTRKDRIDALRELYGDRPNIKTLPDETPVEALILMPSNLHGWAGRIHDLRYTDLQIVTLGGVRSATDKQLQAIPNVGKRFIEELRRYCPARSAK